MKDFLLFIRRWFVRLAVLFFIFWLFIWNWEFIFKKKVVGEVVAVERVAGTMAIVTDSKSPFNPQVFSFSVAIKDRKTNEILMASSEDRQWAAVEKGNCVIAAYFPYPPWKIISKGSTEHNARLLRNFTSCDQLPSEDSIWDKIKFFFMMT